MGSRYVLEPLEEPISRGGSPKDFTLVIRRGFDTEMEPSGAPVFYFQNDEEAKESLDALLSQP